MVEWDKDFHDRQQDVGSRDYKT